MTGSLSGRSRLPEPYGTRDARVQRPSNYGVVMAPAAFVLEPSYATVTCV